MIPYERRKYILNEMSKKEFINIDELCNNLDCVSRSTIWRDLKSLASEGEIILLRGGAAKLNVDANDISIMARININMDKKDIIAKYASDIIQDGDTIYIDSGTTLLSMCKYLINKRITIFTTNVNFLLNSENVKYECIVIGGTINKYTASISGTITDNQLLSTFFDKSFLGATGISVEGGVNTPDQREANKKRIVMNNSKETYVLADNSKIGKTSTFKAIDIKDCIIITNKENDLLDKYAKYIIAK